MKKLPLLISILMMAILCISCQKDDDPELSIPTLTTKAVTSIKGTSALGGGDLTSDGNQPLIAKGVCWSTTNNPTVALATKTDEGTGSHSFDTFITGLTEGTTYFVKAYATNSVGTGYGQEVSFTATAAVGDLFQGGILAYLFQSGDPGYVAGQRHGIICTTSDIAAIQWSTTNTVTGATASILGTGQANTTTIVGIHGAGNYAAKACSDLVVGAYSDWFLPSSAELSKVYLNKDAISITGNFNDQYYWTSTELDTSSAMRIDFSLGGSVISNGKGSTHSVRPIRVF